MVSVGISKLGLTDLIFVHQEVKINGGYYRDMLLSQQLLLPVMRDVSGDFFIFQQDSAPAHRARDTVRFLGQSTTAFIPPDLWLPNSTDLNPVDYKIWGDIQQRVHQSQLHSIDELKKRLLDVWHSMDQSAVASMAKKHRGTIEAPRGARDAQRQSADGWRLGMGAVAPPQHGSSGS